MINGRIIQIIPAPEKVFVSRKNEYGVEVGQMEPSGLLCMALTDQGEILAVATPGQAVKHWANQELKIIKPYIAVEQNNDYY